MSCSLCFADAPNYFQARLSQATGDVDAVLNGASAMKKPPETVAGMIGGDICPVLSENHRSGSPSHTNGNLSPGVEETDMLAFCLHIPERQAETKDLLPWNMEFENTHGHAVEVMYREEKDLDVESIDKMVEKASDEGLQSKRRRCLLHYGARHSY